MQFTDILIRKVFDVDFAISNSIFRYCNTTFDERTRNCFLLASAFSYQAWPIHFVNNTLQSDAVMLPFKDFMSLPIYSFESWSMIALSFTHGTTLTKSVSWTVHCRLSCWLSAVLDQMGFFSWGAACRTFHVEAEFESCLFHISNIF